MAAAEAEPVESSETTCLMNDEEFLEKEGDRSEPSDKVKAVHQGAGKAI